LRGRKRLWGKAHQEKVRGGGKRKDELPAGINLLVKEKKSGTIGRRLTPRILSHLKRKKKKKEWKNITQRKGRERKKRKRDARFFTLRPKHGKRDARADCKLVEQAQKKKKVKGLARK